MATVPEAIAGRETGQEIATSTVSGRPELLRKDLRCSGCGGILRAGTPTCTLAWDRQLRRFRHAPSCSTPARPDGEAEPTPVTKPGPDPARKIDPPPQHPEKETSPGEPGPHVLAKESPSEPGVEAGRDWARIGFTLRLAEFESLRVEVALYAATGEGDAKFTERLREGLRLKAQETLVVVGEVREWLSKGQVSQ